MKKNAIIAAALVAVVGLVVYFAVFPGRDQQPVVTDPTGAEAPTGFCQGQGDVLETVQFETREEGLCLFSDGSRCWQNDFDAGTCSKGLLRVEILQEGTGKLADRGDGLAVEYTGTLEDGTEFSSTLGKGPFAFTLGAGDVNAGWDQGMLGMQVGEKRRFTMNQELGHDTGRTGIFYPNATLIFEVEATEILEM